MSDYPHLVHMAWYRVVYCSAVLGEFTTAIQILPPVAQKEEITQEKTHVSWYLRILNAIAQPNRACLEMLVNQTTDRNVARVVTRSRCLPVFMTDQYVWMLQDESLPASV
jgi:hypothetical protein